MLPLLLLFVAAQVPAVPGEGTLVSFCKQGRLTACQELAKINPEKAAEIQAELAKAALRLEALRVADEEAREKEDSDADESSEAEAAGEPPDCKGQEHHIISRPIARELARHNNLRGLFKPRDPRLKTRAKNEEDHCGYQDWHRKVDSEIVEWLRRYDRATLEQFMKKLKEIYSREDMVRRFPNGF